MDKEYRLERSADLLMDAQAVAPNVVDAYWATRDGENAEYCVLVDEDGRRLQSTKFAEPIPIRRKL